MNMYIRINKAVTTLEVLIVVIILGILAAIAIPSYTNKIERTRGERAIMNIELIADAMKIYRIKNGDFYYTTNEAFASPASFPSPANPSTNRISNINTNLNLELVDNNFYYIINLELGGTDWYDINVVRISGIHANKTLMYTFQVSTNQIGWDPASWHNGTPWPWEPTQPKPWGS